MLDLVHATIADAARVRAVNQALGSAMSPAQVAAEIPVDVTLVLTEWVRPKGA